MPFLIYSSVKIVTAKVESLKRKVGAAYPYTKQSRRWSLDYATNSLSTSRLTVRSLQTTGPSSATQDAQYFQSCEAFHSPSRNSCPFPVLQDTRPRPQNRRSIRDSYAPLLPESRSHRPLEPRESPHARLPTALWPTLDKSPAPRAPCCDSAGRDIFRYANCLPNHSIRTTPQTRAPGHLPILKPLADTAAVVTGYSESLHHPLTRPPAPLVF